MAMHILWYCIIIVDVSFADTTHLYHQILTTTPTSRAKAFALLVFSGDTPPLLAQPHISPFVCTSTSIDIRIDELITSFLSPFLHLSFLSPSLTGDSDGVCGTIGTQQWIYRVAQVTPLGPTPRYIHPILCVAFGRGSSPCPPVAY